VAHLGLDFVGWKGAGRLWRAASAAPVGTGRRTAIVDVRSVGAREWAAWAAPGGLVEVEEGCLGSRSSWTRSSTRLPPMAPVGGSGESWEDRREGRGGSGVKKGSCYDLERGGTEGETTAGSSRTASGSAAIAGAARPAHALVRGAGRADSTVSRRACRLGRSAA
jgi:hypothetical protein